jgi:hypothetical protein
VHAAFGIFAPGANCNSNHDPYILQPSPPARQSKNNKIKPQEQSSVVFQAYRAVYQRHPWQLLVILLSKCFIKQERLIPQIIRGFME